jgi:hypothetical protein
MRGIVLERGVLGACLLVNAFGLGAVLLAEDADEERPGLFPLLEAEVQRLVVVGLLSGTTQFSIRIRNSAIRTQPQCRSMSTRWTRCFSIFSRSAGKANFTSRAPFRDCGTAEDATDGDTDGLPTGGYGLEHDVRFSTFVPL